MSTGNMTSDAKVPSLWVEMIIARGGSSSPGLYISHTGAADAPYSGLTHPGHLASLKVAGKKIKKNGQILGQMDKVNTETSDSAFYQLDYFLQVV